MLSDDRIKEIIEHAVKHTPSAFNSQSARVVLLLENQHDKLWDIAKEALRKIVPADKFSETEDKINSIYVYCSMQRDLKGEKMNYLAHIYLSDNSEENMLGNFLGDFDC